MVMLNNQRVIMGLAPIRCLISVMLPSGFQRLEAMALFLFDDL